MTLDTPVALTCNRLFMISGRVPSDHPAAASKEQVEPVAEVSSGLAKLDIKDNVVQDTPVQQAASVQQPCKDTSIPPNTLPVGKGSGRGLTGHAFDSPTSPIGKKQATSSPPMGPATQNVPVEVPKAPLESPNGLSDSPKKPTESPKGQGQKKKTVFTASGMGGAVGRKNSSENGKKIGWFL